MITRGEVGSIRENLIFTRLVIILVIHYSFVETVKHNDQRKDDSSVESMVVTTGQSS